MPDTHPEGVLMKKVLIAIVVLLIAAYATAIFFPNDPVERSPGTRLSGDLAPVQDTEWAFFEGRRQLYLETKTLYLVPHSITVSGWVTDKILYVGCRSCDGKYWPKNVARDNRVRLKIDEEIYLRSAVRLDDMQRRTVLNIPQEEELPDFAVFRMDPR
jgi:hypothetical protein